MLKGVDASPVVTAKVSTHAITLTRQSLDERGSAYLSYDRVIRAIEGHRSLKNWSYIMKLLYIKNKYSYCIKMFSLKMVNDNNFTIYVLMLAKILL